jgi:hypothetical protein
MRSRCFEQCVNQHVVLVLHRFSCIRLDGSSRSLRTKIGCDVKIKLKNNRTNIFSNITLQHKYNTTAKRKNHFALKSEDWSGRKGPHWHSRALHTGRKALILGALLAGVRVGFEARQDTVIQRALTLSGPALCARETEPDPLVHATGGAIPALTDAADEAVLDVAFHARLGAIKGRDVGCVATIAAIAGGEAHRCTVMTKMKQFIK